MKKTGAINIKEWFIKFFNEKPIPIDEYGNPYLDLNDPEIVAALEAKIEAFNKACPKDYDFNI